MQQPDGSFRWRSATEVAGAYPLPLCAQWSRLLAQSAPSTAFGERGPWLEQWEAGLRQGGASTCARAPAVGYDDESGTLDTKRASHFIDSQHIVFPRKGFGIDLGQAVFAPRARDVSLHA